MGEPAGASVSLPVSVVVDDLHVVYRVFEEQRIGFAELVKRRFSVRRYREIHAVRGVSIVVAEGETVGIVGPNGSGKSTFLRAVAGLLPPRSGTVYARGRPVLLGVDAAVRTTISGRRNVEIALLAKGFTMEEVTRLSERVIEFSGVADFIDLPLRAYSSGMRARLTFAIATVVTPEILMVDEALAVGDKDFREKSLGRMREIQREAGTVFFVSHNLAEVRETCSRVLWMDHGELVADGPPDEIVDAYEASVRSR